MSWPDRLAALWSSERQFWARLALVAVAIITAGVPLLLILVLVQSRTTAVTFLDTQARDGLHGYALSHPGFVTVMEAVSNSGSSLAWQIVVAVLAGGLLWRRQVRLALFVVVANLGSSLLNGAVKTVTNRPRPVVDHPFLHEPGMSFPSGHAQAAVVGYGVLLIVILPHLHRPARWWRRSAAGLAAVMVLAIGFSRVALAVHYVTDVLAGYLLGLAWLVAMAAGFRIPWPRRTQGPPSGQTRPAAHPRPPGSEAATPCAALTTPPTDRESPSP